MTKKNKCKYLPEQTLLIFCGRSFDAHYCKFHILRDQGYIQVKCSGSTITKSYFLGIDDDAFEQFVRILRPIIYSSDEIQFERVCDQILNAQPAQLNLFISSRVEQCRQEYQKIMNGPWEEQLIDVWPDKWVFEDTSKDGVVPFGKLWNAWTNGDLYHGGNKLFIYALTYSLSPTWGLMQYSLWRGSLLLWELICKLNALIHDEFPEMLPKEFLYYSESMGVMHILCERKYRWHRFIYKIKRWIRQCKSQI